jgi:hypothetical protein
VAESADLKCPVVYDHIDKINYKTNADKKTGITVQVPVMGDHEIDLIDTKQHNEKGIKEDEIRTEIIDLFKDEVFCRPYQSGQRKQCIKKFLFLPQESPDMELPGQERPFHQCVDIDGNGVCPGILYKEETDYLRQ